MQADEYQPLIISYSKAAAVRLADVADVTDAVEDIRTAGLVNGKPAILLIVCRQPGANIIDTVDRVTRHLAAVASCDPANGKACRRARSLPRRSAPQCTTCSSRLLISLALVILVVFLFFRDGRTTLIPSVAVPVSLLGTFGGMYLLGYSLTTFAHGADHRHRLCRG